LNQTLAQLHRASVLLIETYAPLSLRVSGRL
jgi:hypothetical protein